MKKKFIIAIALTLIMALLVTVALVGCENKDDNTGDDSASGTVTVNVVVPDGSPAIAIAKLVSEKPTFAGYNISYSIVEGATQISAAILNDTANIAIAPLNLGATMYNKGMGVKLITTNVQGSLYMVGKNMPECATTAEKLASLKGKVVYNIGQGATPDLTFKYILDHFGIKYAEGDTATAGVVTLNYVNKLKDIYAKDESNDMIFSTICSMYISINDRASLNALVEGKLAKDPNNFTALAMHGQSCMNDHKWDDAIAVLTKASGLQPTNVAVVASIGNCYMYKAQEAAEKATANGKRLSPDAEKVIIDVYMQAISYLEKAKDMDKTMEFKNVWAYYLYTCCYRALGPDDAKTKEAEMLTK